MKQVTDGTILEHATAPPSMDMMFLYHTICDLMKTYRLRGPKRLQEHYYEDHRKKEATTKAVYGPMTHGQKRDR